MDVTLPLSSVGTLGRRLGSGGQATVFDAPALRLPDVDGPLVYKQYRTGQSPPHGLGVVAARRTRLAAKDRVTLDQIATWPLRIVQDGGDVLGVVLRRIPDGYMQDRVLPGSGRRSLDLREIQNLFVDPALAGRLGMPQPTTAERLALCRDLARALHFLHRNDLVFGDINAKNAVYQLGALPSIMLVDCDAVRAKGTIAVVPQLNAPDWSPPDRERDVLNQETDRYKFGLFVLRCLAPGPQASVSRDPARAGGVLDVEGQALLRRALGVGPAVRPTLQEWGHYLHWRVTGTRLGPSGGGDTPGGATPSGPAPGAPPPAPAAPRGRRRDPPTGEWVAV